MSETGEIKQKARLFWAVTRVLIALHTIWALVSYLVYVQPDVMEAY